MPLPKRPDGFLKERGVRRFGDDGAHHNRERAVLFRPRQLLIEQRRRDWVNISEYIVHTRTGGLGFRGQTREQEGAEEGGASISRKYDEV